MSWEGMQVLDRVSLVILYIVTLGDEARSSFFKAKWVPHYCYPLIFYVLECQKTESRAYLQTWI